MFNRILKIKDIQHLNDYYFVLCVDIGEPAREVKPGQFFELKRPDQLFPMLRKPISVYDIQGSMVFLMVKQVGKGTELLAKLQPGSDLDVLGPCGNSFPVNSGQKAVLVSGGIGYPPLFLLKQELGKADNSVYWLHGGRSRIDIFHADEIWTDDGSARHQGFVTEGLFKYLEHNQPDIIYACGPRQMLKTCHQVAIQYDIPLYVSLEEYMACGIGVCHGCAVKVKSDNGIGVTYKTVCKDGPVFNADEIIW